jgi:hypothetical protein
LSVPHRVSCPMELLLVTLLNGLVYGMLLFMLASGLTLIFSMRWACSISRMPVSI